MNKTYIGLIVSILAGVFIFGCNHHRTDERLAIYKALEKYPDSIVVGGITFQYGFKNQMLAHKSGFFDTTHIIEKFYKPNQYLFDSCFNFFSTPIYVPKEIIRWNATYLETYDTEVWKQTKFLLEQNIDSLLRKHLKAVQEMTGIKGEARFLAYYPPEGYGISGGCDPYAMAFDLMYKIEDADYLKKVIPHEIEHTIYENQMGDDPYFATGIGVTLDEGLATYFERKYNKADDTIFFETQAETDWLLKNEREIFKRFEPYLMKPLDSACPLLHHFNRTSDCQPLFTEVPTKLLETNMGYFLGYRIIEHYTKIHGTDSWTDIYHLSPKEFYEKSGYKMHILATD